MTNKTQSVAEASQPSGTTSTVNGVTPAESIDVEAVDSFQPTDTRVRVASRSATSDPEQMTAEAVQNAVIEDSLKEKGGLDDTIHCDAFLQDSLREKRGFDDSIYCDAFLKDWDMTIRICPHCQRPFATAERLSKHQAEWISGSCITKDSRYESLSFDESDIEDLVPGADLIVSVDDGKTARRFRVPSQVLATASSCFQVSFGPTAQFESANEVRRAAIRGNHPAEIELDDNPATMELILKILCFRHYELPTTLEFRSIVDIAVVADKYDLDLVLRPWVKKWLEPFKCRLFEFGTTGSNPKGKAMQADQIQHDWVFVSWVFGYQESFAQITRLLSLADAALSHLCTQTPSLVLDQLQALRSSRVDKLRQSFKSIQSRFDNGHSFCVKRVREEVCNTLHLGYLSKMTAKHQLDKSETWDGNFADLAAIIDGMQHMDLWDRSMCSCCSYNNRSYGCDYCTNNSHASCGWLGELKGMASTCLKEDLHLNLSDFLSRVERIQLRSPLD